MTMEAIAPSVPTRCVLTAGGLMFGWNALALALKGQDIYSSGCAEERTGVAAAEELSECT